MRNQRIERFWRDVFRCVCYLFYYVFYVLEDIGLFNIENLMDLFVLYLIFILRINVVFYEYMEVFNYYKVRMVNYWFFYQMWVNGMLNEENFLVYG